MQIIVIITLDTADFSGGGAAYFRSGELGVLRL